MPIDAYTYNSLTEVSDTATKALQNAKQWSKNATYEQGDVVIFNNAFYSANYSNQNNYFDVSAWTKINNSADKLKSLMIDESNLGNGRVLVADISNNKLTYQDLPVQQNILILI